MHSSLEFIEQFHGRKRSDQASFSFPCSLFVGAFWVLGFGFWVLSFEFWGLGFGFGC
jgi:hypothetical protein